MLQARNDQDALQIKLRELNIAEKKADKEAEMGPAALDTSMLKAEIIRMSKAVRQDPHNINLGVASTGPRRVRCRQTPTALLVVHPILYPPKPTSIVATTCSPGQRTG
jgi:hypothetical protein